MSKGTRVLLVVDDGVDPTPITAALPGGTSVRTATLPASGELTQLSGGDAELVIVGCGGDPDHALELIGAANRQRPDRPVVVLYAGSPNGFMERAFAAGADDLITLPQSPSELAFALEKAIARRRGLGSTSREGSMVVVLGPKGGTGKTLTACNLGVALAQRRHSVAIVDVDLQFGDVGLALGLAPERTIYDLAVAGGSLDAEKVESFLATHESGARALLAPVRPDQAAAVGMPLLRTVFEILRSRYDFVIVDTPPAFTPEVIAAIDASSHLCVVGMLDALSLKDTKIGLETLGQMGYDPRDLTLVLNRADTSVGITSADVERILGRRPSVLVPSDRAIPRAITEGKAIVTAEPRSGAAEAFKSLADVYVPKRASAVASSDREQHSQRRWLKKATV